MGAVGFPRVLDGEQQAALGRIEGEAAQFAFVRPDGEAEGFTFGDALTGEQPAAVVAEQIGG